MTGKRNADETLNQYPPVQKEELVKQWSAIRPGFKHKIIVLDDDPTGVQTVHDVTVYTDWEEETIEQAFLNEDQMFFILTNSRAFTAKETEQVHRVIAERTERVSQKLNQPYMMISRGDSTLRGHYPLETEVLRETIEQHGKRTIDGEILIPFFKEGGRLTVDNVHYVQTDHTLVPVGETEFANDRTFGFAASHMGEWIEEKTNGAYTADRTTYISLAAIRELAVHEITNDLLNVSAFSKVVVNAVDDEDVRVFSLALIRAMQKGKNFILRTAATFTKVIGDIPTKPLLTYADLIDPSEKHGGLVVVGSHVQKTTAQLHELRTLSQLRFIELDCHLVLDSKAFKQEIERVRTRSPAFD